LIQFSPVKECKYAIKRKLPMYRAKTDYEKLDFEIKTDGSIKGYAYEQQSIEFTTLCCSQMKH
jgi:DNA-directed RNA polymerase alpha subunit